MHLSIDVLRFIITALLEVIQIKSDDQITIKKFKARKNHLNFPELVDDPKCHNWVICTEIAAFSRTWIITTYGY